MPFVGFTKRKKFKNGNSLKKLKRRKGRETVWLDVGEALDIQDLKGFKLSNYGKALGRKGKRLKKSYDNWGYPCYYLKKYGTKTMLRCRVHVLVAKTFIGPRPMDENGTAMQVDHIDENKENFKLWNLRYLEGYKNLRRSKKSKLKEGEVWLINKILWFDFYTLNFIAKIFKVSTTAIAEIANGKVFYSRRNFNSDFEPTEKDHKLKTKFMKKKAILKRSKPKVVAIPKNHPLRLSIR